MPDDLSSTSTTPTPNIPFSSDSVPTPNPIQTSIEDNISLPPPNIVKVPGGKIKSSIPEEDKPSEAKDYIKTSVDNIYKKEDPPLVDLKVTNPVTYAKKWWKRLLANEGLTLTIKVRPITAIFMSLAIFSILTGTGFGIAKIFFPNSSPILRREVIYQGTVQKTDSGDFYLSLPDASLYKLNTGEINMSRFQNQKVIVKGNLTGEQNLVEVTKITSFDSNSPIF